jgi:hypothetical protein
MLYRYINEKDLNTYERENERLSYKNLFYNDDSLILCNDIVNDYEELELLSGYDYDEDADEYTEIYQYYIINDDLAKRLQDINEIVYYHNRLNIYILGVTHWGTSWDYVLTDLKLIKDDDDGYYKAIYEKEG